MPDTEKPLFKLTPQAKGSFYCLYKWANEEINVYGEVIEWSRRATVYVRGIYSDSVPSSFTLKVDENKPFEILWENVEDITNDENKEKLDTEKGISILNDSYSSIELPSLSYLW